MPTQRSGLKLNITDLYARLFEELELVPRARRAAQAVAELLPASAVNLYAAPLLTNAEGWTVLATAGEAAVPEPLIPFESGTLRTLASDPKPLLFEAKNLPREEYARVNVRGTLQSLAYLRLLQRKSLLGAIEIISFDSELTQSQLLELNGISAIVGPALFGAQTYQEQNQNTLTSITRLTQLYDIEKVFSSTLEMDELLPIIGSKVREMLECEAVNIWLLEADESVRLSHQSGMDVTVQEGSLQKPGEGIPGDVSDNGEPVLV